MTSAVSLQSLQKRASRADWLFVKQSAFGNTRRTVSICLQRQTLTAPAQNLNSLRSHLLSEARSLVYSPHHTAGLEGQWVDRLPYKVRVIESLDLFSVACYWHPSEACSTIDLLMWVTKAGTRTSKYKTSTGRFWKILTLLVRIIEIEIEK